MYRRWRIFHNDTKQERNTFKTSFTGSLWWGHRRKTQRVAKKIVCNHCLHYYIIKLWRTSDATRRKNHLLAIFNVTTCVTYFLTWEAAVSDRQQQTAFQELRKTAVATISWKKKTSFSSISEFMEFHKTSSTKMREGYSRYNDTIFSRQIARWNTFQVHAKRLGSRRSTQCFQRGVKIQAQRDNNSELHELDETVRTTQCRTWLRYSEENSIYCKYGECLISSSEFDSSSVQLFEFSLHALNWSSVPNLSGSRSSISQVTSIHWSCFASINAS